ncbi:hypothetical protein [Burkholderia sp. 22313]|uniref:hypothetical protein n=1 Tax=Burkholderia sp. 22313 TaxID=3453908 RepID=UPI003F84C19D
MSTATNLIWYGVAPLPGTREKLEIRGLQIMENPPSESVKDPLLGTTSVVVANELSADSNEMAALCKLIPRFIDHGIRIVFLAEDRAERLRIREQTLMQVSPVYPWDREVRFAPNLKGIHFDHIIRFERGPKWTGCHIKEIGPEEKLTEEERRLVDRAFPKAQEIHLRKIAPGFSGSKVFMAYEKRLEAESSVAHWTQPRLVKINKRELLGKEVRAMEVVSPFVPFELRPNLERFVEGFHKAVYVADFVDKSESLLDAARAGRAEAAISNLFNRTLHRWRDRARQTIMPDEPLVTAAERLRMVSPQEIQHEYLDSEPIQREKIDPLALWQSLKDIKFPHRVATIHGDLHGDNVRVRGDDAILIDLGAVKGDTEVGMGAPLCFDVAMLEVALVFTYRGSEDGPDVFDQSVWRNEIAPYYTLDAILSSCAHAELEPKPDSWLFGCLQRIRAFGIYEQSDSFEYPIALVVAMWRWCKFQAVSNADRGRRVVALELGAKLIEEIIRKRHRD